MARGLHMIQCSASGAFDLEFGVLAHSGKQSFALSTSAIFQHLPMPCNLRQVSLSPGCISEKSVYSQLPATGVGGWISCVLNTVGFQSVPCRGWGITVVDPGLSGGFTSRVLRRCVSLRWIKYASVQFKCQCVGAFIFRRCITQSSCDQGLTFPTASDILRDWMDIQLSGGKDEQCETNSTR